MKLFRALILTLFLPAAALAHDGFSVGLSAVGSPGGVALNLTAVQPVWEFAEFQLSVRGDVAMALPPAGAPSLGLAAVLSSVEAGIERYLGAGAGIGFAPAGVLPSGYAFGGWRLPVADSLFVVLELQVAFSALHASPAIGLGLQYTFD